MPKLEKSSVAFEHPAKGPDHCSMCKHFLAPHGCEIVRGHINPGDWCKRFRSRKGAREANQADHYNRLGQRTDTY